MSLSDLDAPTAHPLQAFVAAPPGVAMDAYWMPFTANRQFKKHPRRFVKAAGMHYWTDDGRKVLDALTNRRGFFLNWRLAVNGIQ